MSLAHLRALVETGLELSGDLSCEAVLQRIVEQAVELAGCRYGTLAVRDNHGQIARLYTAGIDPATRAAIAHLPERKGILGVPIVAQGQVLGDLHLAEKQGAEEFSEEDEALAVALAHQAALAIKNARLYAEAKEQARQAQAAAIGLRRLSVASAQIPSDPDLMRNLEWLVALMAETCGTKQNSILLVDEERGELVHGAAVGLPEEYVQAIARFPIGPTAACCGTAAYRNEVVIIEDTRTDPLTIPYLHLLEPYGLRAIWSVPIQSREGKILGTFAAYANQPFRPSEKQIELVTMYTRYAAIAIQNAHLFQEMESKNRSLAALNWVAQTVNRSLQLKEILGAALDATLKAFEVEAGIIRLWDEQEGALVIAAYRGISAEYVERMRRFQSGQGFAGKVFQYGEALLVDDIGQYPHLNKMAEREGVHSLASIPIRSREKVVGVMSILSHGQYRFAQSQIDLLGAIGNQIGTAIENARLYQRVQLAAQELEVKVEDRTRDLEVAKIQLEEALRMAEDASRHKSAFLANMSHELRTPLNAIIGFSELLEDQKFGPLNERQQRYVKNIWTSGQHLLYLINDILDLSKVEAGKIELKPEAFPLPATLRAALNEVHPEADAKGLKLTLDVGACPATLVADPTRFKQILFNLLSNAVKFTPAGGSVTLAARVRSPESEVQSPGGTDIGPRTSDAETFVEITVTDTGIGIKAEDLLKLFQPFTQLDASLAKRHQGTGLGLALTEQLVELHGGQIWAESEGEGRGSTFTVTLPLHGPAAA